MCTVPGCDRVAWAKSMCLMHYKRVQRTNSTGYQTTRGSAGHLAERFWSRVDKAGEDDCWNWNGQIAAGYGRLKVGQKSEGAHRVAWELQRGAIPDGLTVDHLCRNKICMNVRHMEIVSLVVNINRKTGHNKKTVCARGHRFDVRNTYVTPDGRQQCRACAALRARKEA